MQTFSAYTDLVLLARCLVLLFVGNTSYRSDKMYLRGSSMTFGEVMSMQLGFMLMQSPLILLFIKHREEHDLGCQASKQSGPTLPHLLHVCYDLGP